MRWNEGGKDCQKYFRDGQKQEARAFALSKGIEITSHGTRHGSIQDSERAAIIAFRAAVAEMPEPRPTLWDCVNAFLAGIANQLTPITLAELVSLRLAAAKEKGVHSRTLRDLGGSDGKGGRLGAFAEAFGERQAATIKAEEIERWTFQHCGTDATRREVLVRLHGLFAYGVKRGFLKDNPVARLEKPRPNATRAKVLPVSEAAALMNCCPPELVPAVAVQLFAGLRKAEAERLNWSDLDFERSTIRVTQRKGAGRRREMLRFVPLLPNLGAWLQPHRRPSGPIFPTAGRGANTGRISEQIYRTGFQKAREAAGITDWDENTLRHCFGSYRVAAISNLPQVMTEMGHTESRTTVSYYINAVSTADADSFWNIRPQPVAAE